VATDHIARRRINQIVQATLRRAFVPHRLEKPQGIRNPPAGRGIHQNKPLVQRGNLIRGAIPFQHPFVKAPHRLHKRQLDFQPRRGHGLPHRFAKLRDDHLFGLIHLIQGATGNNQHQQHQQGRRD
jgi:hypothetical protein